VERGRRVRDSSAEPRIIPFRRLPVIASSGARSAADELEADLSAKPLNAIVLDSPASLLSALIRALRPAQWLKNAVVFAGLIFGGRLLEPLAFGRALLAAALFCLLSGGFYLLNDVRDLEADRLHPHKRLRPIAAGEISPLTAIRFGVLFIALAIAGSLALGGGFVLAMLAYSALMAAYNLGLKHIVILDVFIIAAGFVIRAAAGAIAVDVVISPWLLICTMLLALLIGFGKRRYELVTLLDAPRHRRNLETYARQMLDQSVAVTAAGTLLAYAVYTFDAESAPPDHRMMLTIPVVAFAIFRYLHLLYRKGEGGTPETMLFADRGLLAAAALWSLMSAILFYFST
jgi:4-hydroxybenzoate polyprenyltransferase